jgi:hypothetical protein
MVQLVEINDQPLLYALLFRIGATASAEVKT